MLVVAKHLWHWRRWQLVLAGVAFGGVELSYLAGNLVKVLHGGWLPLLVAAVVFTVMTTWQRGRKIVTRTGSSWRARCRTFVDELHARPVPRRARHRGLPAPDEGDGAARAARERRAQPRPARAGAHRVGAARRTCPRRPGDRLHVDDLGYDDDGIDHVTVKYGFAESPDIPGASSRRATRAPGAVDIDLDRASYFLSRGRRSATSRRPA